MKTAPLRPANLRHRNLLSNFVPAAVRAGRRAGS
jgi:hypothetical protein